MSISSIVNDDLIIPVISALINIWLVTKFSNNKQGEQVSPSRVVIIVREKIKEKTTIRTGSNNPDNAYAILIISILFFLAVAFFYGLYWSQVLTAIKYLSLYSMGLFISIILLYKKSVKWIIFAVFGIVIGVIGWYGAAHFITTQIPANITHIVQHDLKTSDGNFLEAILRLPHAANYNWNIILWLALQGVGSSLLFFVEAFQAIIVTSILIFEALNGKVPLLIMRFASVDLYNRIIYLAVLVFITYLLISGKIYYSLEQKNIYYLIHFWPY